MVPTLVRTINLSGGLKQLNVMLGADDRSLWYQLIVKKPLPGGNGHEDKALEITEQQAALLLKIDAHR